MQFLAQVLVLLFSRAPQRATSLVASPHIGSGGESSEQVLDLEQVQGSGRESWPWGKTPSTSTLPTWADSGQLQTTQPAVEDNSGAAAGWAVVSRGLQPWTPKWSELNELDRMLKQAEQELPPESEQPATQAEQELYEARRAQVEAQWASDKLAAEVKAKRRELSEFIEAERSRKQAAKQQELKKANETQQATAQAAEQAARDAQDLQAAEAEAARQVLAARDAQERMRESQAQVDAKQREVKSITAKKKDREAELAIKQYELKEVIEALPTKQQAAEQAALGLRSLQEAGSQAAEQVRAAQEKAKADAKADADKHEQELMERKHRLEAQVDAKTRELKAANKTELADERAAEQAARDVQRLQLAQALAAEQARAAQTKAEMEATQRKLEVLEKENNLEAEMESKRRELKRATEALLATEAARALHFKQATEALLAEPQAAEQVEDPTQPGCYVRVPSGCPKLRVRSEEWRKDSWAEQQGLDMEKCQRRKGVWDKYCGSTDTQMTFVANMTHSD